MPRNRAVAIVVNEKNILVMKRNNARGEYYTFAGGGIEDGETPERAVVREVDEETSLEVRVERELYRVTHGNGDVHYYYLCAYVGGKPALREGTNEFARSQAGVDMYEPLWLDRDAASQAELYPLDIRDEVVKGVDEGWPSMRIDLTSDYRNTHDDAGSTGRAR